MKAGEERKVCQCRTCGGVFKENEIVTLHNEVLGIKVEEKVSPCCKNRSFGLMKHTQRRSIEGVYMVRKFFTMQ